MRGTALTIRQPVGLLSSGARTGRQNSPGRHRQEFGSSTPSRSRRGPVPYMLATPAIEIKASQSARAAYVNSSAGGLATLSEADSSGAKSRFAG